MNKIKPFLLSHKLISGAGIVVIIGLVYWAFRGNSVQATRYVETTVTKSTIVSSITGSGQVSASNQIDFKSKVSGNITYVGVKAGDTVKKGKALFSIDAQDAEKAVRDAKINLESAKLDLEKFQKAPKDVDISTINNAILDAENSKSDATKAVVNAYTNLLNSNFEVVPPSGVSTSYVPPVVTGNYTKGVEGVIDVSIYSTGNGMSFSTSGIMTSSGNASNSPQPLGDSGLYITFPSNVTTNISNWTINIPNTKASNYLSNKTNYQNALDNQDKANRDADLTIAQQKQKLADLYTPDPIDLRAKQLAVEQRQNALTDAQNALREYYIVAPFDGTIASVGAQLGQPSNSSTTLGLLGTIITSQKLASISLNEVDVAKLKLGQKATLTFDAIPDLSIAGEVDSIDTVGTVTQGVVTYSVKIGFATQDDRIKSGMSVSAAIITNIAQDVLSVPNSAVKTKNGSSYVEVFDTPLPEPVAGVVGSVSSVLPRQQPVEIGLSNDTMTEIISGLKEGDKIVSKTITSTSTASTTKSATSLLGGNNARASAIGR